MNDNVIKQTWLDNGYLVSTISLTDPTIRAIDSTLEMLHAMGGVDHDATGWDFETMVFPQDGGEVTDWGELACRRQQSEAAALTDHDHLVAEYEAKVLA